MIPARAVKTNMKRLSLQDEFLLSRLIDDDLSDDEAAVLRERLAREPVLRETYEAMCRIDAALKARRNQQPEVDLAGFHQQVRSMIAREAASGASAPLTSEESAQAFGPILDEQDEYLLSQLIDGDLDAAAEHALRGRLAHEPALQASHASMQRLDEALATRRTDQPDVDYRSFHQRAMAAVKAESTPARKPGTAQPRRVIPFPRWFAFAAPLAAAAAIALVVTLRPSPLTPGATEKPGTQVVQAEKPAPVQVAQNTLRESAIARPATDGTQEPAAAPIEPSKAERRLLVQFHRPRPVAPVARTTVAQVSYARSDTLAKAIQASDREQSERPAWQMLRTASRKSIQPPADFLDAAAM